MAKILIPTPLRQYAGGDDSVDTDASNAGDALNQLVEKHPDLKKQLFNDEGKLRSFVNVFIDDEDIRFMDGTDTEIDDDANLRIIPSIAGGR